MFIKKPTSRHSVETAVVSKTFGDLRRPFFGRTLNIITASRQVWSYFNATKASCLPSRRYKSTSWTGTKGVCSPSTGPSTLNAGGNRKDASDCKRREAFRSKSTKCWKLQSGMSFQTICRLKPFWDSRVRLGEVEGAYWPEIQKFLQTWRGRLECQATPRVAGETSWRFGKRSLEYQTRRWFEV